MGNMHVHIRYYFFAITYFEGHLYVLRCTNACPVQTAVHSEHVLEQLASCHTASICATLQTHTVRTTKNTFSHFTLHPCTTYNCFKPHHTTTPNNNSTAKAEVAAQRVTAGLSAEVAESDSPEYSAYEEQVQRNVADSLRSAGVRTKQLRNDGAMSAPRAAAMSKVSTQCAHVVYYRCIV